MSYILDALKKADAEREREGVPTLHTQHGATAEPAPAASPPSAGMPWALGGVAAGLVLLVGLWWMQPRSDTAAALSEPAPTPMAQLPVQAAPPAAPPLPQTLPMTAAPAAPVAPTATVAAAIPDAPRREAQLPVQAAPPAAPPLPQTLPMTAAPAAPVAPTATVAAAIPDAPRREAPRPEERKAVGNSGTEGNALHVDASLREAPARVVPVAELPEDVRRELPALSIGGAMHSDVPANRMLVLNGGVFHEGDQPAPGLVLEEIKLKSAVFRFKGHRYSVAY